MKPTLRVRILLAFAAALGVLGAVSYAAWSGAAATESQLAEAARSEQEFNLLEAVLAHVHAGESSVRAYAITGRDGYLDAYDSAYARVPLLLDRLRDLGKDSPSRATVLTGLATTIAAGAAIADSAIQIRQRDGAGAAAESLIASPRAAATSSEIRTRIGDLRYMERLEVAARSDALTRAARRARLAVLYGFALSFGLLALATSGILREVQATERARTALTASEARLRDSAAELQDLYDHSPSGYISLDPDGMIVRANGTLLRWLGLGRDDLVGTRRLRDLLPADEQASYAIHFDRVRERGSIGDIELELQRADGRLIPVLLSATAAYDDASRLTRIRCVVTDRTEIKRARDEHVATIAMLEEALASVKTLTGLLPICSGCRKVRDDQGYWSSVETYVTRHSDAVFSHGLCPECLTRMYPGHTHDDPPDRNG